MEDEIRALKALHNITPDEVSVIKAFGEDRGESEYLLLGEYYRRLGLLDEARKYFDKAIERNPDNYILYHYRGIAEYDPLDKNTSDNSPESIKRAVRFYKRSNELWNKNKEEEKDPLEKEIARVNILALAKSLMKLERYEEGLELLREYITNPEFDDKDFIHGLILECIENLGLEEDQSVHRKYQIAISLDDREDSEDTIKDLELSLYEEILYAYKNKRGAKTVELEYIKYESLKRMFDILLERGSYKEILQWPIESILNPGERRHIMRKYIDIATHKSLNPNL
jgi:tetratricopeptide (TPR) repeat protein